MPDAASTDALATAWTLGLGVLSLQPEAFRLLYESPDRYRIAASILAWAALSEAAGQSVVLFLHRVPPRRFVVSLLLTAVLFAAGVLLWAAVLWLILWTVFGRDESVGNLLAAISLGHAPFLFGFLILIPWLGLILRAVLQIWTLLAVIVALHVLRLPFWQTAVAAVLGWLLVETVYRFASGPIRAVHAMVQTLVYTRPDRITFESLREVVLRGIQERKR